MRRLQRPAERGEVARRQPDLAELFDAFRVLQQAKDGRLAERGRHGGDADVSVKISDSNSASTILRQAPLGDVERGQNFDARDNGARQLGGKRAHRRQNAVNPNAHPDAVADRLQMDVRRAAFERELDDLVDCTHDRRAAGKIAQRFDRILFAAPARPTAASDPFDRACAVSSPQTRCSAAAISSAARELRQ